jgi:hypothetical protein
MSIYAVTTDHMHCMETGQTQHEESIQYGFPKTHNDHRDTTPIHKENINVN